MTSDTAHVTWFVTVAIACFVSGYLAPRPLVMFLPLFVLAPVSALTTLYLWWSEDVTGLFMVGIYIATPCVLLSGLLHE